MTATEEEKEPLLDRILSNPLAGLSPWIVYALLQGKGTLELAAGVAFGIALVLLCIGWVRGGKPKMLEYADVAFFGILSIVVATTSKSVNDWLELWGGELANIALMIIVVGSIVIRRPFTLAYAKEEAPEEIWDSPIFLRTNYIISGVWAAAFVIQALSGLYGDGVLHTPDNLWTGWIIPIVPMIIAVQFTLWYPQRIEAQTDGTGDGPPLTAFLAQVFPLLTVIGIVALFVDDYPWPIGTGFIVAGVVLTKLCADRTEKTVPVTSN
ncbi:MAG: hypothetical protein LLG14_04015 [Nocardiaceae bacterium]|nr:hypothetical protein [Nocardiaceae bacterium]